MSDWYEGDLDRDDDDAEADEDEQFDWDDGNSFKIARHGVTMEEAEEALLDRRAIGMTVYSPPDEPRSGAIGATDDGRVLAVVFTMRGRKMRVITVRDANFGERRRYRR